MIVDIIWPIHICNFPNITQIDLNNQAQESNIRPISKNNFSSVPPGHAALTFIDLIIIFISYSIDQLGLKYTDPCKL